MNPASGGRHSAARADAVIARLRSLGVPVEVVRGVDAAAADRSLTQCLTNRPAVLVACGGDGTVHQALQHVVGTDVALAIAPFGTGNDSATALGLATDPVAVAESVAAARADPQRYVRTVDTGLASAADGTERAFLAVLSSGFDSVVNVRANAMSWPPGRGKYLRAILAELPVFSPVPYQVTLDRGLDTELSFERRGMLVAVGNGPSYGGGMRICPAARFDDGRLDVTFLAELPIRTFLRVFPTVYRGTHVQRSEVMTATALTVELAAAGQVAFADGEPLGPLPVTVRVRAGSLRAVAGLGPAPTLGP